MPWYDLLSDSTKEKLSCNSKNIIGRKGGGSLVVKIANEQTYFRLKKFNCPDDLVNTALAYRDEKRHRLGYSHPKVTLIKLYKKKEKACYYYYLAKSEYEGKTYTKRFSLGKKFNATRMLHAYRTAMVYAKYISLYGTSFNLEQFKHWKCKRLYEVNGSLFIW